MLKGFRQFILRGHVIDLAVAVVIGAAFGTVITALVKDLLTPLLAAVGGQPDFSAIVFVVNGSKFLIGDFVNALVSFLMIGAAVYFFVVVPANALTARVRRGELAPDPTTRKCAECLSEVPIAARRCAFCTSPLVAALLFGVLSLLPSVAHAQAPPAPPPATEGSAELSFVGTSGNSSTQSLGLGGELIYRTSPWETKVKVNYVRNEAEGVLKAQALTFSGRAQRQIKPRLFGYGAYGYLRDRFAGIANRNSVEGGVAYAVADQAPHKLIVDAGLGYANEQRLAGDNLSTATFTTGGVYTLKLSETSELSEDGHFVFSLPDSGDWRFANAAALVAKLTTRFSLKLSNSVRYVNRPVTGFSKTDVVTAIALVAKF